MLSGIAVSFMIIVAAVGLWELGTHKTIVVSSSSVTVFFVVSLISVLLTAGFSAFIGYNIYRPVTSTISNLNIITDDLAASAGGILGVSESLSTGSSSAAASIEETSASLEEISSMTLQNAKNTKHLAQLTASMQNIVTDATQCISDLTSAMQNVTNASHETEKVIRTIDEIAFQTNLLALNAAVEAARAGEAGVGFAVVADEVRSLAASSAQAAKDSANLIDTTIKTVQKGTSIADKSAESISHISESMTEITQLITQVNEASHEQSQGIEQINIAVVEMDKVTQQVAQQAEQLSSSSETLNTQAEEMRGALSDLITIEHPSQEEVVQFVDEAYAYLRQNGKNNFFREAMNRKGRFVRGELYIYAYDFNGVCLAHGARPDLLGKNLSHQDLVQDLRARAAAGGGWHAYDYQNPVTKKMDKKLGYVLSSNNEFWFGSGTYVKE